ncbi:MAG: hypothetical protein HY040_27640 [Planctomycetes bacterium]|nr:hypothetical protein [Planctomycetota bacterium]
MTESRSSPLTFALLDRQKGIPEPGPLSGDEYPLPGWYRCVREVPLDQLSVEDLARAIGQNIHLEHMVPRALRLLESQPLAGEKYEGELLASLKSVPLEYWSRNETDRVALKSVAKSAIREEATTQDVRQDAEAMLGRVESGA